MTGFEVGANSAGRGKFALRRGARERGAGHWEGHTYLPYRSSPMQSQGERQRADMDRCTYRVLLQRSDFSLLFLNIEYSP